MSTKFTSLNFEISGLFRHCSPLRSGTHKGLAVRSKTGPILFKNECVGVLSPVPYARRASWTLDLRDLTGAFHAAQYISDNFDKLEAHGVGSAHDFNDILGDGAAGTRPLYYSAYVGAGQGDPLAAAERKALSKIVLWVAERVG